MSSQNWNIYKQEKGMNMIGKKLKQTGKGILLAVIKLLQSGHVVILYFGKKSSAEC